MIALTTRTRSNSDLHNDDDRSDDKFFDETLVEAYKILYIKLNNECKTSEKQKVNIGVLLQDKTCLMATIS